MSKLTLQPRENFGSKIGVIAATAGSAIGLGNIWRFPYVLGENGGGAFLIVYFLFIIAIGIPVMLSEFSIGRRSQRNPYGAFRILKPGQPWSLVGLMGVTAAFIILAFYSTIAGWTLEYVYKSLVNAFHEKSPEQLAQMFHDFQDNGWFPVMWQMIFMFVTAFIVFKGVKNGIERYAKILMPVLLVIIIIITIRSLTLEGAGDGLKFLFKPDFSKLNANVILQALGQAFFSLSIAMGILITYGSYISKKDNLTTTAIAVSAADTFIALLAGVAIFPAVFAFGIEPGAGEGLAFITLPNVFQSMPGGYIWSLLFFVLLAIAALTSTISVLEVVVAFFSEEFSISRKKATVLAAIPIALLGILCTLSQGPWKSFGISGSQFFSNLEYLSANILLPIGGLLIVVFVGWFLGKKNLRDEISNKGVFKSRLFVVYLIIIRFIAPVAIALVFLYELDILRF